MRRLEDITFEEFDKLTFELYDGNPVLKHFGGSFTAADPSVLTPQSTFDNKWRLFCHTFFGVYCFVSEDGINFKKVGRAAKRAMRPNVNEIDGRYYLFYERTLPLVGNALSLIGGKWKSEIYCRTSVDLEAWTPPEKVIAHTRPFEKNKLGLSISNPFLIKLEDRYRLYYSAGLTFIKDCGFCEPTYISFADSARIKEDYTSRPQPIISPDPTSKYLNICSGCLKVYKLKDRYIGLQNGIFEEDGGSRSAIMLLSSNDAENFEFVKPLILPSKKEGDWMAQFVYACCLTAYDDELRIYFNARNTSDTLKGRESIGFAFARIPKD